MPCQNEDCRSKDLVTDYHSEHLVCSKCGLVQAYDNFQHHFGGISGPTGAFVAVGTTGTGNDYSYRERKIYQSKQLIEDVTFRLNFSDARRLEVENMIDQVTDGEFGLGSWFTVLIGACCYIIMRKNNKPLPITEVCGVVGCELYELGKMISRVVVHLGLELPEFNIVGMLESAIKGFSLFKDVVDEDKLKLMVEQGNFVIQCAIKWYLTTGRRPGPVAAAVLVFVGEMNGIKVGIWDAAKELNVAVSTCKKRYKELLEALVVVAQGLPWGKDVNVKNIVKNAQFVMQYMEMKSTAKSGFKRREGDDDAGTMIEFNMEGLVRECLSGEVDYRGETSIVENDYQQPCEEETQDGSLRVPTNTGDMENDKISYETLAKMYAKFKEDFSGRHELDQSRGGQTQSTEDIWLYDYWWSGRSELCRKLLLQQIVEKDVGFDALPPSYIRGLLDVKRRREKIKNAKIRINEVVSSPKELACQDVLWFPNTDLVETNELSDLNPIYGHTKKKKRKRRDTEIDWEDFIVESLLLHRVKEEEIEKGHYKALLDLHVFRSGVV